MNQIWDAATERKRLENLLFARQRIRSAADHRVLTDYIAGHVWYNWAEYPGERCPMPDEQDAAKFALYRDRGIGLIKVHEEWNDALELYGGDKYTPTNPEAFREFIRLAHGHGMKFIPYASTGYWDRRSRHWNPDWGYCFDGKPVALKGAWFDYAHASPRHPGWRAFILNRIEQLFDSYEIDGLYDDVGYDPLAYLDPARTDAGHIDAFEETGAQDGAWQDLIQEVYAIVHRRRALFTLHFWKFGNPIGSAAPRFKCWDYLYLGEGIRDINAMRRTLRLLPPYVFWIPHYGVLPAGEEAKVYTASIPYLQFPTLYDGRPITGKTYTGDKIQYDGDLEKSRERQIQKHYAAHPDDWPVLSPWDSLPGSRTAHDLFWHYFPYYREMTKPGTHVYIDLQDQSLVGGRSTWPDLVLSAYVNDAFYLVAANFFTVADTLVLRDEWVDVETGRRAREWRLEPFGLKILQRARPD